MEYDLQFYYRRSKAFELSFGPAHVHLRELEGKITASENVPWARQ